MESLPPVPNDVPVDVLPPVPHDAPLPANPPPLAHWKTFYHPASGVAILALDILFFAPEFLTGFLDVPVCCFLAFVITFPLVFVIQKRWGGNSTASAAGKAFLGAFMAGLPFSIAGTIFGAAILGLCGLPHDFLDVAHRVIHRKPMIEED